MHIKFIGPLNCLGRGGGNYCYWSCVYKYITGNAWVSALPKKGMLISVLSPTGYFSYLPSVFINQKLTFSTEMSLQQCASKQKWTVHFSDIWQWTTNVKSHLDNISWKFLLPSFFLPAITHTLSTWFLFFSQSVLPFCQQRFGKWVHKWVVMTN